ncbi:hypothetical protein ASD24_27475 [Paenibacillus sp. Root52]|nr:hypothetical protein ASD24_27475 [Paenibacillus sp. Root52]
MRTISQVGKTWSLASGEKRSAIWYNKGIVHSQTDMWIRVMNRSDITLFIHDHAAILGRFME